MLTTLNMLEMQLIITASHGDPHTVLGMHEMTIDGKACVVVRAFVPQAKSITVIDDKKPDKTFKMEKIHMDGFFECVIKSRKKYRIRFKLF